MSDPQDNNATAMRSGSPKRIVAIGASAGGLEPIEQFFGAMPIDSGLAFVLVQHLSPDFKSRMDQLVGRYTSMKIVHAEDGMALEANTIYLNPPRTELSIQEGKLLAREYQDSEIHILPINSFFNSLARDQGSSAIGIVLSGTGSDGTLGSLSIRQMDGIVISQDLDSSKFQSMPRSAKDRGGSAVYAHPTEMPDVIQRFIAGETISDEKVLEEKNNSPEMRIFTLLQQKYGADFGLYKRPTVDRRIKRRSALTQHADLNEYANSLETDITELEALYSDLLIGVTSFLRDKEAFSELSLNVLTNLVTSMSERNQVRIWTPGCASGQEAYTLAILISEIAREQDVKINLKIFATDLHFNSLKVAGTGVYSPENMESLPPELVERYFDESNGSYQIKKSIRGHVVFSRHNLLSDPPFTNIDLITCRNLMIYFNEKAQKKVLASFHFALKKDAVLFLGPSESIAAFEKEFEAISDTWKIFKKTRDVRLPELAELLPVSYTNPTLPQEARKLQERRSIIAAPGFNAFNRNIIDEAFNVILKRHRQAGYLVDRHGDLLHIFGDGERYLKVTTGPFTRKLSEMVKPGLSTAISSGIDHSNLHDGKIVKRQITLQDDDENDVFVHLVIDLMDVRTRTFFYITVEERYHSEFLEPEDLSGDVVDSAAVRIRQLEDGLKATEQSLQSSVEELESSNEELQSTNEELMASNEELQSTNEELHSVNEELYTVSAEHQRKIEELTELTSDMDNLFKATEIGTIFLDNELRLRRYTPAAAKTFNLVFHDLQRPIDHITYNFELPSLLEDLRNVQSDGVTISHEVQVSGRIFQLKAFPYSADNKANDGVVLTIIDIDELKQAQEELVEQRLIYANVVDIQSEAICRIQPDGQIFFVNPAFCETFSENKERLTGRNYFELIDANNFSDQRSAIKKLTSGEKVSFLETGQNDDGSETFTLWTCYALDTESKLVSEYQIVGSDVTEKTRTKAKLEELNHKLEQRELRSRQTYLETPVMMHTINKDGEITEASNHWLKVMGYEREEIIGHKSVEFLTSESADKANKKILPKFWETGYVSDISYQMVKKNGEIIDVKLTAIKRKGLDTDESESLAVVRDVSNERRSIISAEKRESDLTEINSKLSNLTIETKEDFAEPLRAAQLTLDWIDDGETEDLSPSLAKKLGRLKAQLSQMNDVVDNLADHNRNDYINAKLGHVDTNTMLQSAWANLDEAQGVEIDISGAPTSLFTKHQNLNFVFKELLSSLALSQADTSIPILVVAEDKADNWRFLFKSNGQSMSASEQKKILTSLHGISREMQGSTNKLSLAKARQITELSGGELSITSDQRKKNGWSASLLWPKFEP